MLSLWGIFLEKFTGGKFLTHTVYTPLYVHEAKIRHASTQPSNKAIKYSDKLVNSAYFPFGAIFDSW